jgi:hypothetical protein
VSQSIKDPSPLLITKKKKTGTGNDMVEIEKEEDKHSIV